MLDHPMLHRVVRKLARREQLDESDRQAVTSLHFTESTYEPGGYIVREGSVPTHCTLILHGFAFRQKLTQEGGRQIVSIHIPGDFIDLDGTLLKVADHNVQALTRCTVASIRSSEVMALMEAHPRVARAMWVDTLIDGSVYREWVTNVGRRSARSRIAHLFCELAKRFELVGLGGESGFILPMTQEQVADATGLTPVHVNRSLMALEEDGLIHRRMRKITIPDWERLRKEAGFSEIYLHLDQAA